ncbi:MAG: hypothetical protein K0S76_876 [Herbinix sp.]|jgi:hypothetical protein|nr:hypothetical protein [Herbinix sp.]
MKKLSKNIANINSIEAYGCNNTSCYFCPCGACVCSCNTQINNHLTIWDESTRGINNNNRARQIWNGAYLK